MRENPNMGEDLVWFYVVDIMVEESDLYWDNFYRHTGDTSELARQQVFAWDATKHNADVHMQGSYSLIY
jgi:hypothetical protein